MTEVLVSRNPARPDDRVAEVVTSVASLDGIIARAVDAAPRWAAIPAPERADLLLTAASVLHERREATTELLTREVGKTQAEATGEAARCGDILRYHAAYGRLPNGNVVPSAAPGVQVEVRRVPVGTLALITPWNFPAAIPLWKLAPALVHGNTAILKPAEQSPACAQHVVTALHDAGIPDDVVQVAHGDGVVGAELVADPRIDAVSFTGSAEVGSQVRDAASRRGARVQCELGGKNPLIVLEDADLDVAVRCSLVGTTSYGGQKCTATGLLLVHEGIWDRFIDRLADAIDRLRVGDPAGDVDMGPLIGPEEARRVEGLVTEATAGTASVATRSGSPAGDAYVPASLLADVDPDDKIAREEVFGPVAVASVIGNLDEGIEIANALDARLVAGICTTSLYSARQFCDRVRAGTLKVNSPTTGLEPQVAFGGFGASGTHSPEQGTVAADFYTEWQSVYVQG